MAKSFPEEVAKLLSVGVDLESFGSANWALTKSDALDVVAKLSQLGIAIAGGDVWELSGSSLHHTYDNWYLDQKAGELYQDYQRASVDRALSYIMNYKYKGSGEPLFEIVPNQSLIDLDKKAD
jgi:hypothetical protein